MAASACVNNIGMSPENFLDCSPAKFSSYGWSPRMSFSREFPDGEASKAAAAAAAAGKATSPSKAVAARETDLEASSKDIGDFEFRLEDPVSMLPADELFYDGKLVPLQLSTARPVPVTPSETRSPDTPKLSRRDEISVTDPYLFSPKAPRCSSRWKELLGLKKLYQNSSNAKAESNQNQKTTSSAATKSLKNFLHRCSKSSGSSADGLHLPLLKETVDNDSSVSLSSSRLSLSSSSSGHEHDDLPRLSLDADKPSSVTPSLHRVTGHRRRVRVVKPRSSSLSSENPTGGIRVGRSPMRRQPETVTVRGVSVDSPRMNSSGKIVFHSLERSSSSPSSFNGGPKYNKHRAMERSYSANVVRVTPVLNVPVCTSLRGGSSKSTGVFGFPLFSSSQPKKEGAYHHHSNCNRK